MNTVDYPGGVGRRPAGEEERMIRKSAWAVFDPRGVVGAERLPALTISGLPALVRAPTKPLLYGLGVITVRSIRISDMAWEAIANRGLVGPAQARVCDRPGETVRQRRVIDIGLRGPRRVGDGGYGRGNKRFATWRMSARLENSIFDCRVRQRNSRGMVIARQGG